jgi:hypothetical protein
MHQEIPQWVYITFTVATAVGVVIQAVVLVGILFAVKGALGRFHEISKKVEEHALPMLETTRRLVDEISPKLKVATQNVLEVSQTLRAESKRAAGTFDDLLKKATAQTERLDEMVTGTLNIVAHATATVQRAVIGPVRQVEAVWSGLRAGFDVLRNHKERDAHAAADGEHFT